MALFYQRATAIRSQTHSCWWQFAAHQYLCAGKKINLECKVLVASIVVPQLHYPNLFRQRLVNQALFFINAARPIAR